jgi:hypothetical protein
MLQPRIDRAMAIMPIALILSLSCVPIHADESDVEQGGSQFTDPLDGKFDASRYLAENAYGFLPVPTILTEPALGGFGLGMFGIFFHESKEERDERMKAAAASEDAVRYLLPPSVSVLGGLYTANDSWMAGGGHMAFWKEDHIRYRIGGGYGNINIDVYGTSALQLDKPVELHNQGWFFNQRVLFRIADSKFLLGLQQTITGIKVEPNDLQGSIGDLLPPALGDRLIPKLETLISTDDTMSALGLVAQYDSRDNMFSPEKGFNYRFDYYWYDDAIGSDYDYQQYQLTGLNYWRMGKYFLGGIRLVGDWVDTDEPLPFYALPFISLRGIPAMRYQGEYVSTGEVQLTWRPMPRWSVLGFAGAGRTGDSFSDLKEGPSYTSRGLGFRYLAARRYSMNMGVDVARGPDDTVVYIQVGSGW